MRLVVGACLGLVFLVPGIASAQADVILRAPLMIAGQPFGPAAESPRLYDHQATRVADGVCTYPVGVEIANVGGAATTSPVAVRLEVFGVIAAAQRGITLAAGQSSRLTMPMPLRPGFYMVEAILGETAPREDRKFLKAAVVVRGPCRPAPEHIIILPPLAPPSESTDEKKR